MRRRHREVVLLATIDYGYQDRNKGRRLHPQSDSPYEMLEREARRIIETELPSDLQHIYGLDVHTRVIDVRAGSLLVFFGAVVSGVSLFSGYAGFFDSIKLLKQHCALLLGRAARDYQGSEDLEITVVEQFPTLPDPSDFRPWRRLRHMFGPESEDMLRGLGVAGAFGSGRGGRDGFFWFLLIFNILLLAALGVLVGGAVVKTYFH